MWPDALVAGPPPSAPLVQVSGGTIATGKDKMPTSPGGHLPGWDSTGHARQGQALKLKYLFLVTFHSAPSSVRLTTCQLQHHLPESNRTKPTQPNPAMGQLDGRGTEDRRAALCHLATLRYSICDGQLPSLVELITTNVTRLF
jgi:hypothetical protein